MSVLSKDDFLNRIKSHVGEDSSDEALSFIEDMNDTYSDLASRSAEDWKEKYERNDADWRKKYKERFFSSRETTPEEVKEEQAENVKSDGEEKTFADLFEKREG